VAAARLALVKGDEKSVRQALEILAGDKGSLSWALRGRWQCAHCGNRPGQFSWRCGQCRRWGSLRMETGIEPPPVASRERRASPRSSRPEVCSGQHPMSDCRRRRSTRVSATTSSRRQEHVDRFSTASVDGSRVGGAATTDGFGIPGAP
jgi:hypothetical protein